VVYRVEKSKVLMDVITNNNWELRLSTRSLEFFKIHIWLTIQTIRFEKFTTLSLTVCYVQNSEIHYLCDIGLY